MESHAHYSNRPAFAAASRKAFAGKAAILPNAEVMSACLEQGCGRGGCDDWLTNNCAIMEQTGDGKTCGRCWFHCPNDVCPRHGDVSQVMKRYRETGKTTLEFERGLNVQGSSAAGAE